MHVVNSIGNRISAAAASAILSNMMAQNMIDPTEKMLMQAALSDTAYKDVPQELRDALRASLMKNMLATLVILKH